MLHYWFTCLIFYTSRNDESNQLQAALTLLFREWPDIQLA